MSMRIETSEAPWLRLLSRWALGTALLYIALLLVYIVGVGFDELAGAARNPAAYRLGAGLDSLVWLGIGGILFAFAGAFVRLAPLRASLLAVCGIGQLAGVLGGFLRLSAVGELAARHAAASVDQQVVLAQIHQSLLQMVMAHYGAAGLLGGPGFLLVASLGLSVGWFPRWLAIWCALAGTWQVAGFLTTVAGSSVLLALYPVYALGGGIGLELAIAAAFWRRAAISVTQPAPAPVA
jgi:hypothetical protein